MKAIITVLDWFAGFLVLHLIFYAFSGIAFWGVNIGEGRSFLLIVIHSIIGGYLSVRAMSYHGV